MPRFKFVYYDSSERVVFTSYRICRDYSEAMSHLKYLRSRMYPPAVHIFEYEVKDKDHRRKRRTSSKSGYDHKKELASFSAEIDRIKASLKKKANKRKS